MDFGGCLAVVGSQDASGVLDELFLVRDGCGQEERVQRGIVEAFPGIGTAGDPSRGGPPCCGCSRASAAARSLAPIPPRSTTGSWPAARSPSASFNRCAIQLMRTRQFLPCISAAVTSVMTFLHDLVTDFAQGICAVAANSRIGAFYQPVIGPHTEAQTIKLVMARLANADPQRYDCYRLGVPYADCSRSRTQDFVGEQQAWVAKPSRSDAGERSSAFGQGPGRSPPRPRTRWCLRWPVGAHSGRFGLGTSLLSGCRLRTRCPGQRC